MNGQQLKNSILQMAVEGKLVPQNENDEPASILIDRIAKEKEQLVKDKKIKKDKNVSRIFQCEEDSLWYEEIDKGEIKCIEEELPFGLPDGWSWIRLNEIGVYKKGPFGSSLTKSMFVVKGIDTIKVYEQKNAIKKNHTLGEYYITKKYYDEKMKGFSVLPNDIIVSCAGTIGETYILPDDIEEGIINQALMKITMFSEINKEYFLIYFDYILKQIAIKHSKGSAIKNIPPFEIFKKLLMPLPPLAEQQRIVSKIEELLPFVDDYGVAHSKLEKLNSYFPSDLKKSLLQWAVQGKLVPQNENDEPASVLIDRIAKEKEQLVKDKKIKKDKNVSRIFQGEDDGLWYEEIDKGEIKCIEEELPFAVPMGWSWCRLGSIISISSGKNLTTKNMNENMNYAVYGGNGITGYYNDYMLDEESLVIGRVGYYCGSVHITEKYSWVTDNAFIVDFSKTSLYINWLKKILTYLNLGTQSNSTAQPVISGKTVYPNLIPIPPLAEQHRIVEKLESVLSEIERL